MVHNRCQTEARSIIPTREVRVAKADSGVRRVAIWGSRPGFDGTTWSDDMSVRTYAHFAMHSNHDSMQ